MKNPKYLVAIDPGKEGGIATYFDGVVEVHDLESDLKAMYAQLSFPEGSIVYVEDVGYHRKNNSAMSSATFARHCGHIEAFLTACEYNWCKVKPVVWMRRALPAGRPRDYDRRKKWIVKVMQIRFPDLEVTKKNADALGILVDACRIHSVVV